MFGLFKKRQAPRFLTLIGDKGETYTFMRRNTADWNKRETVYYIAPDLQHNNIGEYEFAKPPIHADKWREATEEEINKFTENLLKVYKYRYNASHK